MNLLTDGREKEVSVVVAVVVVISLRAVRATPSAGHSLQSCLSQK